jgi:hypothetical protein
MINALGRVLKARLEIPAFKIGQFLKDLLGRQLSSEQFQNVRNPNAHTANTRATAALLWVGCNP